MRRGRMCVISGFFICVCAFAPAETVLFKTGEVVKGSITKRTQESITVETAGIPLTFSVDEIESIDGKKIQEIEQSPIDISGGRPFSVYIPEGWISYETKDEDDRRYVFSKDSLSNPEDSPRVGMTVVWGSNKLVFIDWETIQNAQKDFWTSRSVSIVREGPEIVDQRPAYTIVVKDRTRVMMNVFVDYQPDLVTFVCEAPREEWEEYEAVFKRMVMTFSSGTLVQKGSSEPAFAQAQEWFNRGLERIAHGKFKEAVEYFERSRELNPQSAEVCTALGTAYVNLGEPQKAFDVLHEALRIQPDLPAALLMLGSLYVDQREYEQAREYLGKAKQAFQRLGDNTTAQIAEDMIKSLP